MQLATTLSFPMCVCVTPDSPKSVSSHRQETITPPTAPGQTHTDIHVHASYHCEDTQ